MNTKRTRTDYILYAFFLMLIFFIGASIINNLFVISDNKSEEISPKTVKTSDLIIDLFSKSNSWFKYYLEKENKESSSIYEYVRGKYFNVSIDINNFVKSQFPALFSLANDKFTVSDNKGEDKSKSQEEKTNAETLEDLILIEDELEKEEGKLMEEDSSASVDVSKISKPSNINPIKVDKSKPYIVIYHTHGTEGYLPIKENQYHTTERKYNMLTIGDVMYETLNKDGYNTIHIDTYHDIPSYGQSYSRSLKTITSKLKEEPNLKVVFDVHRDGVSEDASYIDKAKSEAKVKVNGEDVATFSLVIGPDSPNVKEVTEFAKYIKNVSDKMYPGLCKGIIIKPTGRFNQFVTNYYALIEVGSNLNTIDEAKASSKLIAKIIGVVMSNIISE
ncbi:hypothetical protein EQM13_11490 [Acidilutibacter cellobiosedens]|uniref:Stage II sporulation protein P n=1 Tax=Acidilutibacter cellobiosedens TaxID=2507161 RepID=A0A410QDW5_9FIRM|nr:stage II sporulation protein P [Acidilutibacter cellobiosedens]QAT62166.1 hypothetical protein EQM13_11490 [Acidilutibacter cellobiosedens]